MIAGMWFQDLFNYDFRRTEMCIIPYATQQGEISFCAYNTGIGWRKIIENMYKNATVAQWYKEHGKHEIYAKGKAVSLDTYDHSLVIDAEDAARVRHVDHEVPEHRGRGKSRPAPRRFPQGRGPRPQDLRRTRAEEGAAGSRANRLAHRHQEGDSVRRSRNHQQRQWKRERRGQASGGRAGRRRLRISALSNLSIHHRLRSAGADLFRHLLLAVAAARPIPAVAISSCFPNIRNSSRTGFSLSAFGFLPELIQTQTG